MCQIASAVSRGGNAFAAALAGFLLLVAAAGARAEAALYEVQVPLAGTTAEDRKAGLAEAMGAVAVKVSGRREAAASAAVAGADPARYVQRYSTTPQRMLKVGFDAAAVDRLLEQAGLPFWPAERPLTLVDAPLPDPAPLEAAAQWRGLPIAWSSADAPVAGAARALLKGVPSGTGFAWSFTYAGRTVQGHGSAEDGVNLAADTLAALFAPPSTRSATRLELRIGGMEGLPAYAGLLAYLRALSLVSDVQVEALEGPVVTVRMAVRGDREQLARVAALDGRLLPAPPVPEGATPGADFVFQP
jgi:hypothetical protein